MTTISTCGVVDGELLFNPSSVQNTAIKAIAVSPDGLNFVSAFENGGISIWDSETGLAEANIQLTTSLLDSAIELLPLNLLKETKT